MVINHNNLLCDASEDLTFSITAEGNAFCNSDWNATELFPPFTRLYYIVDGSGEIETIQGKLTLKAGYLYLLPIGHFFSHRCDDHMQQLYFHVNLTNSYGADILRDINKVLFKKIEPVHMQKLLSLFEEDSFLARGYLKSLLQADIFDLLLENRIQIKNKELSPPVRKALTYIEEKFSASLTVKDVVEQVGIPAVTLCSKFKAEMGVSISKHIAGLVMHQAEVLLISTSLSLSDISELLGFYDQFYFSRRFKELYSIPPLKYRKNHQSVTSRHPKMHRSSL